MHQWVHQGHKYNDMNVLVTDYKNFKRNKECFPWKKQKQINNINFWPMHL